MNEVIVPVLPEITNKRKVTVAGRPKPEALSRQTSMQERKRGPTIVTGEMKMNLISKVKRLSQNDLAQFIEFVGSISDSQNKDGETKTIRFENLGLHFNQIRKFVDDLIGEPKMKRQKSAK